MAVDLDNGTPETNPPLTDHVYDGIQEFDYPLPGWWLFLFWFFIVISPFYLLYFHCGAKGRSIHDSYNREMASVFEKRFEKMGTLSADEASMLEIMSEHPDWLKAGKAVYQTNCVGCHGSNGEGVVGPNLTDEHWKNVRGIEDIVKVVKLGAANGAMPAWEKRLSHPNQIILVAAYVASMRDRPVSGKPVEGAKIGPWQKKTEDQDESIPKERNALLKLDAPKEVVPEGDLLNENDTPDSKD